MLQTVTQNSTLSQNWVECTGTHPKTQAVLALRPGHAQSAVSQRRIAARLTVSWPLLRLCRRHVLPCRRAHKPYRSVASRCIATQRVAPISRYKNCIVTQSLSRHCAPCRALCRASRSSMHRIVAHCCAVSQRGAIVLYYDTKHRIATHLARQAPRARAVARPCVRAVRVVGLLAVSQRYCAVS